MTETTMTERTWRFDSVGVRHGSNDRNDSADPSAGSHRTPEELGAESEPNHASFGFVRQWTRTVNRWLHGKFEGVVGNGVNFEDILHEFSTIIETTDRPEAVQAGILKQSRRLMPGYRIELIAGPAPSGDHCTASLRSECESTGEESPSNARGDWSGRLVLEVPLRCGSLVRGRLRIRSRGARTVSLRNETVRRLNTLCTIGASALDRLCLQEEWPWDDNVAHHCDPHGADSNHESAKTDSALTQAARLQDATFLNAVLPFALSQARRHSEPLSIVCVAIDRLHGIQDLLGRAAVDRLVRHVGETVGSLIRGSDIVVRLDDDRVVAVLPRAPGKGALEVAQRICRAVAENTQGNFDIPNVTVSIGVATFPSCADNVVSLFSAADDALGRAQSRGRNQAALAPPRSTLTKTLLPDVSVPANY
jgi:diguanylate cyclase (GGDEF)-like protein